MSRIAQCLIVLVFGVLSILAMLLGGCASTGIERGPDGFRYFSQKDVALEGLEIERRMADGSVEKIKVAKAGGDASSVNSQWAGLLGELVRRIPAAGGLAAAPLPAAPNSVAGPPAATAPAAPETAVGDSDVAVLPKVQTKIMVVDPKVPRPPSKPLPDAIPHTVPADAGEVN